MKLNDKVAVVTGTSPNIGGGIAEGLAAEGATLVCVDARPDNANDCANYIKSTGGRALGITCDVHDEAQVTAAVQRGLQDVRTDRRPGEQRGILQQEGRAQHAARRMATSRSA